MIGKSLAFRMNLMIESHENHMLIWDQIKLDVFGNTPGWIGAFLTKMILVINHFSMTQDSYGWLEYEKKTVRKLLVIARGYVHVYSHSSQSFSWLIGESPCLMPPKKQCFFPYRVVKFHHLNMLPDFSWWNPYVWCSFFFNHLNHKKSIWNSHLNHLNPLDPYIFVLFFQHLRLSSHATEVRPRGTTALAFRPGRSLRSCLVRGAAGHQKCWFHRKNQHKNHRKTRVSPRILGWCSQFSWRKITKNHDFDEEKQKNMILKKMMVFLRLSDVEPIKIRWSKSNKKEWI